VPVNEPIRFYKTAWPWGYFGNFSRHPIKLDGAEWPTTEHYYQAQKFVRTDPEHMDAIRVTEKAGVAANMGRDRNHPLDPAWEEIKYHVMLLALIAKFTQNDDCNAMLLTSGDRHIIEDTGQGRDDDHIWGDGSTGTGQNLLGKALMEVRDAMRRGTLSGHGHHLEGTTRLAIRQAYERIPAA
jgi:ribA/ribD-fused uncharacterized protein